MDKRMTRQEAIANARLMTLDASAHLLKVAFLMTVAAALFWLAPLLLDELNIKDVLKQFGHMEEFQYLSIGILYVVMLRASMVYDKMKARHYVAKRGWRGRGTSLGMILSLPIVGGLVGGMHLSDFVIHATVVFSSFVLVWVWRFFSVSNQQAMAKFAALVLSVIPIGLMVYIAIAAGDVNLLIYGNSETGVLALASLCISIVMAIVLTHSVCDAAHERMGVTRNNGPVALEDRWG